MRAAHTVTQVRAAEAELMARLPDGALMQRAAAGLAAAVIDFLGSAYGRRIVLLVGSGDNGGDALWAGAMLARRGAAVEAVALSERVNPQPVHAEGLAALQRAGGRLVDLTRAARRPLPDLVIDGIVGIGGRPGLRPDAVTALAALTGVPIVAVDVPSGVDVDTGGVSGPHVRADLTVTFGTYKVAHLAAPAAQACGAVELVPLGLDLPDAEAEALQADDVARLLPRPAADAHKYSRGVVGLRTGAGYPGAALLSVAGADLGLAGMVRFDTSDDRAAGAVVAAHPEVVIGSGRVQAWVVGSGEGDADRLAPCLADRVPVVIDADALAGLGEQSTDGSLTDAILTPHAGELARIAGVDRADIESSPVVHARSAAQRWGCVVLLKGPRTVIAAPDGRVRINTTGTPWLATAGAGDVLAGLIGALAAAGLQQWDAASVGAWLHGTAATLAGAPLTASALAASLPAAVAAVLT